MVQQTNMRTKKEEDEETSSNFSVTETVVRVVFKNNKKTHFVVRGAHLYLLKTYRVDT